MALKWYGKSEYNPTIYNNNPDKALFIGVKTFTSDITLYLVEKDTISVVGSYLVNDVGKSASIDVLADGTVVTAAEEGSNGERNYYTSFTRYSQSYLANLLK